MKLHCEICALYDPETGSYRIGSHSEIAEIDLKNIALPLEASMFLSHMAERGVPAPWRPGVNWNTMKCPRGNHNIFVVSDDRAVKAMKDGGPEFILTDDGWFRVTKETPEPEVEEIVQPPKTVEPTQEDQMIAMKEAGFSNAKIGKRFGLPPASVVRKINQYKRKLKRGLNAEKAVK